MDVGMAASGVGEVEELGSVDGSLSLVVLRLDASLVRAGSGTFCNFWTHALDGDSSEKSPVYLLAHGILEIR